MYTWVATSVPTLGLMLVGKKWLKISIARLQAYIGRTMIHVRQLYEPNLVVGPKPQRRYNSVEIKVDYFDYKLIYLYMLVKILSNFVHTLVTDYGSKSFTLHLTQA